MNELREKIREEFIRASNGEFLEWPAGEQEAAIQRVFESVNAAMGR